jgi:glycosyltransferase involved in cell wall biosynthesis
MRVLGFINPFDELAEPDRRLGRKVANYGLVSALLQYSTAEELHFFLPFAGALGPFKQAYAPWLDQPGLKNRARLIHAAALPSSLANTKYLAFHAAEVDRYFPELCHLRNKLAKTPFPVTCTTHTLSYWSTQVRHLYKVLPGPRAYDAIFCSSQAAKDHLARAFKACGASLAELGLKQAGFAGRLEVMPLGVEAAEFGGLDRKKAQHKLGLKPGVLTLLCLGRLTPSDKFDLKPLLGAVSLLARRFAVRLILAGEDSRGYGQSLLRTASALGIGEKVHLFANFDTSLKPTLFAAADVFISPADNLQETFGLSLLEAMAAGLPVLASDFSGYRDLVQEEETGFLIPTLGPADFGEMDAVWPVLAEHIAALQTAQRTALDMDLLLDRLTRLAASKELRAKMGRLGRQRVLDHFDWRVVVRRMEALWQELSAQAKADKAKPPAPDLLGAGLGTLFGNFFTRALRPSDVVSLGPLSDLFSQGAWAEPPHPDLALTLPPEGLARIVEAITRLGGQAPLLALKEALAGQMPSLKVEHLTLYGLKYGVLSRK